VNAAVAFTGKTFSMDLTAMTPGVYLLRIVNLRTKESVQKQVVKF
jgi:hypothetical protein